MKQPVKYRLLFFISLPMYTDYIIKNKKHKTGLYFML